MWWMGENNQWKMQVLKFIYYCLISIGFFDFWIKLNTYIGECIQLKGKWRENQLHIFLNSRENWFYRPDLVEEASIVRFLFTSYVNCAIGRSVLKNMIDLWGYSKNNYFLCNFIFEIMITSYNQYIHQLAHFL